MSVPGHDRNLLFGILAVQMDFISRDALVAAMNAWVLSKQKALGEILVAQKAITADRRTLLEALVQEHLKQHGNDPEKSLASVSSLGFMRDDLRQIKDVDVQASLANVPAARPPADRYATMAEGSVGSSTSSGSRFRILRPHAKGGLGQVSVARDEELHREVALKEIQERHADNPDSRSRFLLEAEITGGLEHPGIVPVYGLGQYADGRPYYAMRFIRGDSLQEAVARFHAGADKRLDSGERAVALRGLLGRFVDVCNAIAYAHSRGVLHRDLKPGNIMLGQYGETLVVDWGLAKPQDPAAAKSESVEGPIRPSTISASSATLMGSAIGTPQYMSPEQATGRLDLLGPPTDVYSLGATLYCLLTGRPPFEVADVETILRNVERGEFPPPRAVNRHIAPPLEAICLKAMALKPEDRYASPKDLANEVEHWLADEPVAAYREGLPAKAARWARKHKTLVVTSFGLITAALIALAVTTVLVQRQQVLTAKARDEAKRALQLANDALNDTVQDIVTRLEKRPDLQDLRKDLLKNAQNHLQKLVQEPDRQGNPDQTLVWSYFRLGDVDQVLGETQAAKEDYKSGYEHAEQLVQADPNSSSALSDLGISYINLGAIDEQLGQTQEALDYYQKALQIRQRRAALDPQDAKAQRGLSISYEKLGDLTRQMGKTHDELDYYRKSVAIRETLAEADKTKLQAQYDLSVAYEKLGDVTLQLGQKQDALDYCQKDAAICERLVNAEPKDTEAKRRLGVSDWRLGNVKMELNQMAEAEEFYRKALTIFETLAHDDPKNVPVQSGLSIVYVKLGDVALRLNRSQEAFEYYKKARAIREPLASSHANNTEVQRILAVNFEKLGDATFKLGQNKESLDFYEKALAIDTRLAEADRKNAVAQSDLLSVYSKSGKAAQSMHDRIKAAEYYQKALDSVQGSQSPDLFKTQLDEIKKSLADLKTAKGT
jgi:eukaryotic-like serine/threonine-protein kinase